MDDRKELLTESVSTAELQRRWSEVRKRMQTEKIDFLVMQNDNAWLGGYVKWFTDISARNGYPMTVIFPVDDEMTTINSGGKSSGKAPGDFGLPAWAVRGVKKRLTAPYFRSLMYSNTYDAELAVETLKVKRNGKMGIVGKGSMSASFYEYLRRSLPEATLIEATDLVDEIKAIKSDEEIALIKKTVALQDEAMEYAKEVIRPGKMTL